MVPCEGVRNCLWEAQRQSGSWAKPSWKLALVQVHRDCQSLLVSAVQEACKAWVATNSDSTVLLQCHCLCSSKDRSRSRGQEPVTYLGTRKGFKGRQALQHRGELLARPSSGPAPGCVWVLPGPWLDPGRVLGGPSSVSWGHGPWRPGLQCLQ